LDEASNVDEGWQDDDLPADKDFVSAEGGEVEYLRSTLAGKLLIYAETCTLTHVSWQTTSAPSAAVAVLSHISSRVTVAVSNA